MELAEAWTTVLEQVGSGDADERREEGATVRDWRPPGEGALREDGATGWLRHAVFEPLEEAELAELEEQVGRSLPAVLRRFLAECSNGLSLLGGDLEVYGLRRDALENPFELHVEGALPADAPAGALGFGGYGGNGHALYLDGDERVHLSGLGSATPLRSWPDLGTCLVEVLREGLDACWDDEGRRVGELPVPEETAEPPVHEPRALQVPKGLEQRAADVRSLLADGPGTVTADGGTFVLAQPEELGDRQVGFAVGADGEDFTGEDAGDWRPEWLVVGTDEDLGDPLFVDLRSEDLPALTAMHGEGSWDPREVAPSLRALLGDA